MKKVLYSLFFLYSIYVTYLSLNEFSNTYVQKLLEDKCEKAALLEIRSFIIWYLKGMPKSKEIKNLICQSKTSEEMFNIIEEYKNYLIENN